MQGSFFHILLRRQVCPRLEPRIIDVVINDVPCLKSRKLLAIRSPEIPFYFPYKINHRLTVPLIWPRYLIHSIASNGSHTLIFGATAAFQNGSKIRNIMRMTGHSVSDIDIFNSWMINWVAANRVALEMVALGV